MSFHEQLLNDLKETTAFFKPSHLSCLLGVTDLPDVVKDNTTQPEQFKNIFSKPTNDILDETEQAIHLSLTIILPMEGFAAVPYLDKLAGRPVWTVGYGSTHWHGDSVKENYPVSCTKEQAVDEVCLDCDWVVHIIETNVGTNLNVNQMAALISFIYNEGAGQKDVKDGFVTLKSGEPSTMLKMINNNDFDGAAKQFLEWDKSGGVVLPGLQHRRMLEAALFSKPIITV